MRILHKQSRRQFLSLAGIGALAIATARADEKWERPAQIVDTHTHFYDPARPQGVPWPGKNDALLYKTTLPAEFKTLTAPFGITGTIIVEASEWVEDNQWLLDLAAKDPFILGIVGNLNPTLPEFGALLKRFAANPLYRGMRLNQNVISKGIGSDAFLENLRAVAAAGLQIDVLGGYHILDYAERISQKIPELRIVIDHFSIDLPADEQKRQQSLETLKRLGDRANVFAKVSNVLRKKNNQAAVDVASYRAQLDLWWSTFGNDRVLYGSNWPVSNNNAPYGDVFNLMRDYLTGKDKELSEKYFWKNSQAAYRWLARN